MKDTVNFMVQTKETDSSTINYVIIFWGYGYSTKDEITGKIKYEPLKMPTGITISDPEHLVLNESTGKRRIIKKEKDYLKSNGTLDALETKILNYISNYEFTNQEKPSPKQIKNHLTLGTVTTTVKGQTKLSDLTKKEMQKPTDKNKPKTKNTKKNYQQFLTKLELFEKQRGGPVYIEQITKKTFEEFEHFLHTYKINDEGDTFKVNSVGKFKSLFKRMLSAAESDEITFNFRSFKKDIKAPKGKVKNVYLDEEKIQAVINADLSEHPHLIPVRDYFLIGLFTGLRISDMQRLKTELHLYKDKDGGHYVIIEQTKTGTPVKIPIDDLVVNILNKYGGAPEMVEQVFNRNVKEVCRLAGLTKKEALTIHTTSGTSYESEKFYDLVSSHTMRRSFCTNLYEKGIPPQVIMKFSGHTKYESFKSYICVNDDKLVEKFYNEVKTAISSFKQAS